MFKQKLFGDKYAPLFQINYKNTTSHIFGSCHNIPFSSLGLNYKITEILQNRKTLVTEAGNCLFNDKFDKSLQNDDYNRICEKYFFNERFMLTFNYILKYSDKTDNYMIRKKWYQLPGTLYFPNKKLYSAIRNEQNVDILQQLNVQSLSNVIYANYIIAGMDYNLVQHYHMNNLPVLALDHNESSKIIYQKYYKRNMRFLIILNLLDNDLHRALDTIKHDYLFKSHNRNNKTSKNFLLENRNKQWINKIVDIHCNCDDPLFVFGVAHTQGQNNVLQLLQDIGFSIEIYDIELEKFVPINVAV